MPFLARFYGINFFSNFQIYCVNKDYILFITFIFIGVYTFFFLIVLKFYIKFLYVLKKKIKKILYWKLFLLLIKLSLLIIQIWHIKKPQFLQIIINYLFLIPFFLYKFYRFSLFCFKKEYCYFLKTSNKQTQTPFYPNLREMFDETLPKLLNPQDEDFFLFNA